MDDILRNMNWESVQVLGTDPSKLIETYLYTYAARHSGKHPRFEFIGCSYQDAAHRGIHGWPEGVEQLDSLAELDAPIQQSGWRKTWSDVDGDTWDMERYMDERPFLQRRVRDATGSRKGKFVKIRVNIGELASVRSTSMLWKSWAAGRLADELEAKGFKVEITIEKRTRNALRGSDHNVAASLLLKESGEPLNISMLLAWTAPWAMRFWYFYFLMEKYGPSELNSGFGGTLSLIKDENEFAFIIDNGDCLSKEAADEFISKGCVEVMEKHMV